MYTVEIWKAWNKGNEKEREGKVVNKRMRKWTCLIEREKVLMNGGENEFSEWENESMGKKMGDWMSQHKKTCPLLLLFVYESVLETSTWWLNLHYA